MRRVTALAALIAASAVAGGAAAAHWTKYADVAGGKAWSYEGDYSYKDKASGRLVVMQAVSIPEKSIGPGAPGATDGVGNVVAIDCTKKNLISLGSYTPSKPMQMKANWRSDTPKKAEGAENQALLAAVCQHIEHVPEK